MKELAYGWIRSEMGRILPVFFKRLFMRQFIDKEWKKAIRKLLILGKWNCQLIREFTIKIQQKYLNLLDFIK